MTTLGDRAVDLEHENAELRRRLAEREAELANREAELAEATGRETAMALARAPRRPPKRGIVPVRLGLVADIKFFGRHKRGSIRDGVILSVQESKP